VQSQVKFNRVLEKFPEKVWEALVQSNRVLEKVPEKVGEALVQSQVRFNRVPEKVWHVWFGTWSGSTGFAASQLTETQMRCFQRLGSTFQKDLSKKVVAAVGDTTFFLFLFFGSHCPQKILINLMFESVCAGHKNRTTTKGNHGSAFTPAELTCCSYLKNVGWGGVGLITPNDVPWRLHTNMMLR